MRSLTRHLTMNVPARMDFVNITAEGERAVADLGEMLSAHEPEAAVAAVPGPRITVAGIFREP